MTILIEGAEYARMQFRKAAAVMRDFLVDLLPEGEKP